MRGNRSSEHRVPHGETNIKKWAGKRKLFGVGDLLASILKGPVVGSLELRFLSRQLRVHVRKGGYLDIVATQNNHGSCLSTGKIWEMGHTLQFSVWKAQLRNLLVTGGKYINWDWI